jgi:hypothetical protein
MRTFHARMGYGAGNVTAAPFKSDAPRAPDHPTRSQRGEASEGALFRSRPSATL